MKEGREEGSRDFRKGSRFARKEIYKEESRGFMKRKQISNEGTRAMYLTKRMYYLHDDEWHERTGSMDENG